MEDRLIVTASPHIRDASTTRGLMGNVVIALIPMGVVMFLKQYVSLELPLRDSVEATVAALIGMIPEGLYLLTSVALAVSMVRLAQRKVLAQDMNCIFWRSSLVCIMVRLKTLWQIKPSGKTLAGRLRIGERQRLVAVASSMVRFANTCSWLLWLVLE